MKQRSILVGNGVNLLSDSLASWRHVLEELADSVGQNHIMDLWEHKPFSLLYEEIALRSGFRAKDDEFGLKQRVADSVSKLKPNRYHKLILEAAPTHVVTTNYDYSLELSAGDKGKRANLKRESRYNVFRSRVAGGKRVWHIHGEVDAPNTITLGHEQYSGQLQQLRNYATSSRKSTAKTKSPFKVGNLTFERTERVYSWIDVFFRDDIHIIGLSLDYTEIDLWWLLAYKERLRQMSGFQVGKTTFHHLRERPDNERTEAKLGILHSLGVEVETEEIRNGDYEPAYERILHRYIAT